MNMPELDLSTCEDWNLRALLLRLAAINELIADYDPLGHGDPVSGSCWSTARETAERRGLMVSNGGTGYSPRLTPLGRKLAEALRPEPWRVKDHVAGWFAVVHESAKGTIVCESRVDATHIAVLLSANDEWKAKQYRSAP